MKARWLVFFSGVVLLTILLLTGYQPVAAAPPMGEVKIVASSFGKGIPIPYLDTAQANDWIQLVYDHLVGTTPDGKLSTERGLANKWEMSPDGLTWTFTIRRGVKFHDGVELTAKDVKFSIEQLMLPESVSENAPFVKRAVKSIDVKDPYTLVIHCKKPSIFLLDLFNNMEGSDGMVVPKEYFEKVGREEFAKRPIGTGPYKWHSQQIGSFIKLEATDKHWRDGVPKYKYMTFLIIPEEVTRLAMLKTGEADIARIGREVVKEAMSSGLNVITKENGAVVVFQPNMQWTSPVFSDIRFRKALNLAIDRDGIIKQLFGGLAKPLAAYPGSNFVAVGGDLKLKPYPYAPQEASRLIKEGGWEGYEFTVVSYERAGCPEFQQVIEALAGYWQKIGLKPKINISDWSVFRHAIIERKTQNIVNGNDITFNPVASTMLIKTEEKFWFEQPQSTVNIPVLNEKFEKIQKSMNTAEVSKLMGEIYRYAYDNYLLIPICEFPEKIAVTKRIPKWNPGAHRADRNLYDLIKQR